MKTFYLRLSGAAVMMMLLSAGTTMAASPRHPNTGIAHPTYASQQAKRQTTPSYRVARPVYSEPVQSRRSFSYQPRIDAGFKAGEHVKIVGDGVKLMRGSDTIATLNKGLEFVVLKVQGGWLGATIEIGGQAQSGWVAVGDVVGIAESPALPSMPDNAGHGSQQKAAVPCH